MPDCQHGHKHPPWPKAGTLVICPGERACGYCKGRAASVVHDGALVLRKHVYHQHTDGGALDYAGVRLCLYPPYRPNRRAGSEDELAAEDVGISEEEDEVEFSSPSPRPIAEEVDARACLAAAKMLSRKGVEQSRTRARQAGTPTKTRSAAGAGRGSPQKKARAAPPAPIDTATAQEYLAYAEKLRMGQTDVELPEGLRRFKTK